MDSGIVCTYYSVDEAIENGAAPIPISSDKSIDVRCTIDIIDHLVACEVFTALTFHVALLYIVKIQSFLILTSEFET